jgi:hypothetical protein
LHRIGYSGQSGTSEEIKDETAIQHWPNWELNPGPRVWQPGQLPLRHITQELNKIELISFVSMLAYNKTELRISICQQEYGETLFKIKEIAGTSDY